MTEPDSRIGDAILNIDGAGAPPGVPPGAAASNAIAVADGRLTRLGRLTAAFWLASVFVMIGTAWFHLEMIAPYWADKVARARFGVDFDDGGGVRPGWSRLTRREREDQAQSLQAAMTYGARLEFCLVGASVLLIAVSAGLTVHFIQATRRVTLAQIRGELAVIAASLDALRRENRNDVAGGC